MGAETVRMAVQCVAQRIIRLPSATRPRSLPIWATWTAHRPVRSAVLREGPTQDAGGYEAA